MARYEDCLRFVDGADYVLHCAALIPPRSDHNEKLAYECDYLASKNLVDAINASPTRERIKFVYIGTVAEYGNRNRKTMWGRVGDPMISSDYDCYSMNKIRAERYLFEHRPANFVSLRQTAIAHKYLFANNMSDGLMFHTSWNGPLEWVSDRDSGRLLTHLVAYDMEGRLKGFWNRIYNIGGGRSCRATGFESVSQGFALMGRSAKDFFSPEWNITRNFHGCYFLDGDELESILHFRRDSLADFWARMGKKHWCLKLAKIVPPALIKSLVFKPLLKDENAPMYWVNNGYEGHVKAFFGGREAFAKIPRRWAEFNLYCEGRDEKGEPFDNEASKDLAWAQKNHMALDHGYDESKPIGSLTIEDMRQAAAFRGGECLSESMKKGDLWTKLKWRCAEGHEFTMSPFTLLFGGYWCPLCEQPKPWATGKLAAHSPFFAQVYFADHDASETVDSYPLGGNGEKD
ncbi:MAG: NAD-dependent epimerase/dehydratase family protein [Bacilli bacterium]|nr:NAD-dependent epimerase/dehydratase family protein [Bacilli bacterium]